MASERAEIVPMSDAEYFGDPHDLPSLSASIADILLTQSAEHAWLAHPRLGGEPFKATRAMDIGTLAHSVLLKSNDKRLQVPIAAKDIYVNEGKKNQELRYRAFEPFTDYTLKAAQEVRKQIEEGGGVCVLQREVDDANRMAEVARKKFKAHWLIAAPEQHKVEHVMLWHERADSGMLVPCRAKLDLLNDATGKLEDLKTCDSAHPKAAKKHVERYGAAVQHGAYVSGFEHIVPALAGRASYGWVFVETEKPHAVLHARPAGSMRMLGEALWRTAVNQWARCLETGDWPGYDREEVELEASPHAMAEMIELEEGRQAA